MIQLNRIFFLFFFILNLVNSSLPNDYQQTKLSFQKTIPSLKGLLQEDLNQRQKTVDFKLKEPIEHQNYVFKKETIDRELSNTDNTKTGHYQRIYEYNLNQQNNKSKKFKSTKFKSTKSKTCFR
jgi:hypothetical protein